jgi:hypothetical protein
MLTSESKASKHNIEVFLKVFSVQIELFDKSFLVPGRVATHWTPKAAGCQIGS